MENEIPIIETDEAWDGLDGLQVAKSIRTMMKLRKVDAVVIRHKGKDYPMSKAKVEATIERLTPPPVVTSEAQTDSEDVGF